jgi:hypothetical protein
MLESVHVICKTYNRLPHEIMAMDFDDFTFTVQVLKAGNRAEKRELDRAKRRKK